MGTDRYDKLRAPPAFVRDGLASQTSLQGDFLGTTAWVSTEVTSTKAQPVRAPVPKFLRTTLHWATFSLNCVPLYGRKIEQKPTCHAQEDNRRTVIKQFSSVRPCRTPLEIDVSVQRSQSACVSQSDGNGCRSRGSRRGYQMTFQSWNQSPRTPHTSFVNYNH